MQTRIRPAWPAKLRLPALSRLILLVRHLCLLLGLLATVPSQAALKPGDILAVSLVSRELFVVDPKTGVRSVLSRFSNSAQDFFGTSPLSVAVDDAGHIYVSVYAGGGSLEGTGAIFGVDPNTGMQSVVSDFGQGDLLGNPDYGFLIDKDGQLITNAQVVSTATPTESHWSILRIDPKTGLRTVITDILEVTQKSFEDGFDHLYFSGLAEERNGKLLVGVRELSGAETDVTSGSLLFRIDPVTATPKLLSTFSNPAQGIDSVGLGLSGDILAIEKSGRILAASDHYLLRINQRSGVRTTLSDFTDPVQGVLGRVPRALSIEKSGDIIAAGDLSNNSESIIRINPKTGKRTVLSDGSNPAQGPSFIGVTSTAVIPQSCGSHRVRSSLKSENQLSPSGGTDEPVDFQRNPGRNGCAASQQSGICIPYR